MADKSLTSITLATTAALTDLVYMVISGNSRRMTLTNLRNVLNVFPLSVATTTAATYTLVEDDFKGGVFRNFSDATSVTITIPSGLSNAQTFTGCQSGAGVVIIEPAMGVTILAADDRDRTRVQHSTFSLVPQGSNTYRLVGDIIEEPAP